jgi:hypothetical protein
MKNFMVPRAKNKPLHCGFCPCLSNPFSLSCCAGRIVLSLDSRFRGNDDEGQGGWDGWLHRKSHDSGSVVESESGSRGRQWILSNDKLGHAAPLSPRFHSGLVREKHFISLHIMTELDSNARVAALLAGLLLLSLLSIIEILKSHLRTVSLAIKIKSNDYPAHI